MDQAVFNDDAAEVAPAIPARLLVVDDDRVLRLVITRIARQAGYEVAEAASYESLRRLLGEGGCTCATLDLTLGEHGGVDVLQHLAEIGFDAPIIVVSGSDENVREQALLVAHRLGLNVGGSFGKPLNLSDLRNLLSEIRARQVVEA